jgi:uncharacterized membrane protein
MDTNRLEAFSDGVFSIAITLLILEIKVPPSGSDLGRWLLNLWPSYLAYGMSFVVIGAIWINHHTMFDHIVRTDQKLLLLNTFHLMFISFLPFPTAILAQALHDGADERLAISFYGGTLTIIGVLVTVMWHYAAREHRLLGDHISRDEAKSHGRMLLVGPMGYFVATLTALVAPWVAVVCYIALNVFFLWPRHRSSSFR